MICKNLDDFLIVFKKYYDKKYYKNNFTANWVDDANVIWQKIIKQNKNFFDKHGYIDINYNLETKKYHRKKLSKGRPKKDKAYKQIVSFRIDDDAKMALNNYCKKHNISMTKAINMAIKGL